jgi:hypothetical protein
MNTRTPNVQLIVCFAFPDRLRVTCVGVTQINDVTVSCLECSS